MNYPLSMTSFGRGENSDEAHGWTVELRSVNHKFCDIRVRLPRQYNGLEEKTKNEVSRFFTRGHIDVTISPSKSSFTTKQLRVNIPLAHQYRKCLHEIKSTILHEKTTDQLALITGFPNVIESVEPEEDMDSLWPTLHKALKNALTSCTEMREREGQNLKKDLLGRLDALKSIIDNIESMTPELVLLKENALQERLAKLLDDREIEPMRLAQEVAILADKTDVTEELVRINSHIDQFHHFLEKPEPVGRRLDFLLQEFNREINTISSKISNSTVAHLTVELKNEVEKMREQVQNLE